MPAFTVDATGHVTEAQSHLVTIPANTAIAAGGNGETQGVNGLMTAEDKAELDVLAGISTATSSADGYMAATDKEALDTVVTQTQSLEENVSSLTEALTLKNADGTIAQTAEVIPLSSLY